MNKKIVVINIFTALIAFGITAGLNIVLAPFLIKNLGKEAYGFVSLANSVVSYGSLATVAINSMSSRYVAIYVHKNEYKKANIFFNSAYISDIFMAFVLLMISIPFIINIRTCFQIPISIVKDVQYLFVLVIANFLISLIANVYTMCYYITNKLYKSSNINIQANIAKVLILFILYTFFPPHIFYIGLSSILVTIYSTVRNVYDSKKIIPKLKFNVLFFKISTVVELLKAGVWNFINQLGSILNEGLDLLICNIFIDSAAMGNLALAKTIPTVLISINGAINNVFAPNIVQYYAKNDKEGMITCLNDSICIMGLLLNIPFGLFWGLGNRIFELWVPSENYNLLYALSILSIMATSFCTSTLSIYHLFTAMNKLKFPAVINIIGGLFNTVVVYILLNTTTIGVFAIAGVSSFTGIFKTFIFTFPYAASCISKKWYYFYKPAIKSFVSVIVVAMMGKVMQMIFENNNVKSILLLIVIVGILGLIFNFFFVLNKTQRVTMIKKVLKK